MRVTIHQPEHMPWPGFFHKINMADTYVVLDNVQYRRRYFQNRNKIRTADGWQWVTVPLEKETRDRLLIKDARIWKENLKWKSKNLESIYHNYRKAEYFIYYWNGFESIYNRDYFYLADFNLALLKFFFEKLKIRCEVRRASEMDISGRKGDLIFNICRALKAKKYISGISGKEYLNLKDFKKVGIGVVFQEFHHPVYKQLHKPFIACMSIIDLLFNYGDRSLNIIRGKGGVPLMEEVIL
ncbi:MAG: WbqC family protein [Candidatus Omnitrophota bacterium]|nr:MAG: WbqC family protein [Candidatus Omnitrophota bacterium]